ncbi:unnamed protein product [Caenorhabditis nigoni]
MELHSFQRISRCFQTSTWQWSTTKTAARTTADYATSATAAKCSLPELTIGFRIVIDLLINNILFFLSNWK